LHPKFIYFLIFKKEQYENVEIILVELKKKIETLWGWIAKIETLVFELKNAVNFEGVNCNFFFFFFLRPLSSLSFFSPFEKQYLNKKESIIESMLRPCIEKVIAKIKICTFSLVILTSIAGDANI
jgi:hypothetical protein